MATFIGFSTQAVDAVRKTQVNSGVDGGAGAINNPIRYNKKFRTVDEQLVVQDLFKSHLVQLHNDQQLLQMVKSDLTALLDILKFIKVVLGSL